MNCQICQRAIYRNIEVGGEDITVCPTWDCMYSHYLQTQAKLLQVYTTHYKQHSNSSSSLSPDKSSSWAMKLSLSTSTSINPTDDEEPHPRKLFRSDEDIHKNSQIEPDEELVKISLTQDQTTPLTMCESHESTDSATSESQTKVFDWPYEFTNEVLPPDMEEDAIDYLRFHMKYFGKCVSPHTLLLSLNFIINKLDVEDSIEMNTFKFQFDMYMKVLHAEKIKEVNRILISWIKKNKMLISRIKQELKIKPKQHVNTAKDQKVKQEKKRIIQSWDEVQDIPGLNVDNIDDIEALLEDKLRSH